MGNFGGFRFPRRDEARGREQVCPCGVLVAIVEFQHFAAAEGEREVSHWRKVAQQHSAAFACVQFKTNRPGHNGVAGVVQQPAVSIQCVMQICPVNDAGFSLQRVLLPNDDDGVTRRHRHEIHRFAGRVELQPRVESRQRAFARPRGGVGGEVEIGKVGLESLLAQCLTGVRHSLLHILSRLRLEHGGEKGQNQDATQDYPNDFSGTGFHRAVLALIVGHKVCIAFKCRASFFCAGGPRS